jgi:DNA-binding transcriptional MerR regulator
MAVSHAAKIGQVANETGLSIDTIRFYEKQGLLKRSPRDGRWFPTVRCRRH